MLLLLLPVRAQFKRLSEADSVASAGLPLTRAEALLGSCRQELFQRRAGRPRPALDDKVGVAVTHRKLLCRWLAMTCVCVGWIRDVCMQRLCTCWGQLSQLGQRRNSAVRLSSCQRRRGGSSKMLRF
jgi:hypothetical protein